MGTTCRKTSKVSRLMLPVLIGVLIIGMQPTVAEAEIIGKQLLQTCIGTGINGQIPCSDKLKITVAVSHGWSSTLDVLQSPATGRTGGTFSLIEGVRLSAVKSAPIVTYPLKFLHTVPYFPYEEVVKVTNTRPGTQSCIDYLLAPNPTCGWTYQGNNKIPYSLGFCNNKDLVELIRGDPSESWRGEEILGEQPTLLNSFSTGHCMRLGELYFHGYEIGEPIIDYEITITTDDAGTVHMHRLTPDDPLYNTQHDTNYSGSFPIKSQLLGAFGTSQQVPQLGNYILYIPSSPDTHAFVQDYQHNMLLVPREELSKAGTDLNKVGISFLSFRQQADAADRSEGGDGLHNQLSHKHQGDLQVLFTNPDTETEYLVNGKRIFKAAMDFGQGMEKSLKYEISEINHSLVSLSLDAQDVKAIEVESLAVLDEANVETFESMSNQGNMVVKVRSYGNSAADYVVSVTECNQNIVQPIPAQAISLNRDSSKTIQFDIFTQFNMDTTNECKVTLTSPSGKVYDETFVIFDTQKHQAKYPWELHQPNEATE